MFNHAESATSWLSNLQVVRALHAAHKDDKLGDAEAAEAALLAELHAELHPEKEGISTEPAETGKWE